VPVRKLLLSLVVLGLLLVGVDRAGDYVAERAVAQKVQASQHLGRTPEVDIAGFPFLTQLARQRFDEVTVRTTGVPVGSGNRTLTLSRATFTFDDVRTSRRFSSFTAATGRASGRVGYPELSRVLGLTVSYAGKGQVKAGKVFTIAGQKLRPTITVQPRLVGGALSFGGGSGSSGVPAPVVDALRQALDLQVPLSRLPFGAKATSLHADAQGLVLRLAARDVSYGG